MIAFFGMGLLGSNFVRALRERGEPVQIYNRSPEKARALEETGAQVLLDPASAARSAKRLHLTLSDDASVDEVLELARPGLSPDVHIIDHTTTSPDGTRERVARWAQRGIAFTHAPVFMGPANARDASGVMLISGERAHYEALEPALSKMTGELVYLGTEPDQAAKFKLLGNAFSMFLTAGTRDLMALGKSMGLTSKEAVSIFEVFNSFRTLPARIERILRGDFQHPSWELVMARKDARLMLEAAARVDQSLTILPAIAEEMDAYIEQGHGHDDWTVITKDVI